MAYLLSLQAHLRQEQCRVCEPPGAEGPVLFRVHQLVDESHRVRHLQRESEQEEEARAYHCHPNQFLVQAIRSEYLQKYLDCKGRSCTVHPRK